MTMYQKFSMNFCYKSNLLPKLVVSGFSSGKFGTIVIGLCQVFNNFSQWCILKIILYRLIAVETMTQIPVTTIAVALMDRCGRRPLLLVSGLVIIHKLGAWEEQLGSFRNKEIVLL